MSRKRRHFRPTFKAKVALESVQGLRTISELAQKHKLHPTQINLWKKQLVDGAESVFENGHSVAKGLTHFQAVIQDGSGLPIVARRQPSKNY